MGRQLEKKKKKERGGKEKKRGEKGKEKGRKREKGIAQNILLHFHGSRHSCERD
jgi:hypothetical protein